jgi:hypothetical protein
LSLEPGMRPPRLTSAALATPDVPPPGLIPIYLANLTARVMPNGATVDRAMKALDVGHEWVVRGFDDLTTAEMHRHWGKR